jgi:16S rRNA (uracil1498-N3)-methyltransferase
VLPGAALTPGELLLPREVARHALVARVAPGEPIEVLNLAGVVGIGVLLRWEGHSCRLTIEQIERERGEPPAALMLALGMLHTAAFDWAVEKATELGATSIVPVLAQRCQGRVRAARCARWQRIAVAAVAQCGRTRVPEVRPPRPLAALLDNVVGARVVAEVGSTSPAALPSTKDGIALLVGPEGGFTAGESEAIRAAGFVSLPLGPRPLRAETAALAGLALVQSLAGWLD